jgi:hypothetical protein
VITALARSLNGSSELIAARLSLVTAPAIEPLTIAEAKRQIKMDSSAGEPAPSAPTVALPSTPVAGNCDNGAWRIGYTFVTADGETDLAQLSDIVTIADKTVNGKIAVTAIAIGGSAVTARKAYAVPPAGGNPKYVATISDNTTTTQTVNIAAASLGADAPTTNTTADPELRDWITSARLLCESDPSADGTGGGTGRALITQTYDLKLDGFPWGYPSSLSQFDYLHALSGAPVRRRHRHAPDRHPETAADQRDVSHVRGHRRRDADVELVALHGRRAGGRVR